ncbi:MAG: hypothetical protein ABL994_03670, partial [Verrucomicrobiales bacterium]
MSILDEMPNPVLEGVDLLSDRFKVFKIAHTIWPNVNVATPALAGCVPRLDGASEVLPQAAVEVTGLNGLRDRVGSFFG